MSTLVIASEPGQLGFSTKRAKVMLSSLDDPQDRATDMNTLERSPHDSTNVEAFTTFTSKQAVQIAIERDQNYTSPH